MATALHSVAGELAPTGTLPVMYIDTDDHQTIPPKTEPYVHATYRIVSNGFKGVDNLEGETQIRGRGNATWLFDKKPYRLKLTKKAKLMGLQSSKHFALLAHPDDELGFLREPMGFKMSELLGMAWTPAFKPLELVLNGEYWGLYFLVETIRVDKNRVNIFDQEEEAEDNGASTDITGGWLCEFDNYVESEDEQVRLTDSSGHLFYITHKSPEIITDEQREWLIGQFTAIDSAFYNQDPESTEWQDLVDIESLVKYYFIREAMNDVDGFHGSWYWYRDRGADQKWHWGPLWDVGNTFYNFEKPQLTYEDCLATDYYCGWLGEFTKFTAFKRRCAELIRTFIDNNLSELENYLDEFNTLISEAGKQDFERWKNSYPHNIYDSKLVLPSIIWRLRNRLHLMAWRYGCLSAGMPTGYYVRDAFSGEVAKPEYELKSTANPDVFELSDCELHGAFKVGNGEINQHFWYGAPDSETILLKDSLSSVIRSLDAKPLYYDGVAPLLIFRRSSDLTGGTVLIKSTGSADSIDDLELGTDAAPVYYNLQGQPVASPPVPGIYIRQVGNRVDKVIIR